MFTKMPVAVRHLIKNWVTSLLTVFSLCFAMALALLILMRSSDIMRWGEDIPANSRVFNTSVVIGSEDGKQFRFNGQANQVHQLLAKNEDVEVLATSVVRHALVKKGDNRFRLSGVLTGYDYATMFPKRSLHGDYSQTLKHPDQISLSYEAAIKLFGTTDDLLGKVVSLVIDAETTEFSIGAVLAPYQEYEGRKHDFFYWRSPEQFAKNDRLAGLTIPTQIRLQESITLSEFQAKHDALVNERIPTYGLGTGSILYAAVTYDGADTNLFRRYTSSNFQMFIYLTLGLGLLGLVNHAALSTSIAVTRQREIAMRKILGASKRQLATQFISESVLVTVIAYGVAILLASDLSGRVSEILGGSVTILSVDRLPILLLGLTIVVCAALLVASVPLISIMRSKSSASLEKTGKALSGKGGRARSILIFVQATAATAIITVGLTVNGQLQYLLKLPRGYDLHDLIDIEVQSKAVPLNIFADMVRKIEGVEAVSLSSSELFGREAGGWQFMLEKPDANGPTGIGQEFIQDHTLEALGIKLLAGRLPHVTQDYDHTKGEILEWHRPVAVKVDDLQRWGLPAYPSQAIGQCIYRYSKLKSGNIQRRCYEVTGILSSFQKADSAPGGIVIPTLYVAQRGKNLPNSVGHLFVKLDRSIEDQSDLYAEIEQQYLDTFPDDIFGFTKGTALLEENKKSEIALSNMLLLMALASSLIAGAGVYSLMRHVTEQRQSEIALRKIFGASRMQVFQGVFIKLLYPALPGITLGMGLAYFAGRWWLENYEKAIEANMILLAPIYLSILAFYAITPVSEIRKALNTRPADALRRDG